MNRISQRNFVAACFAIAASLAGAQTIAAPTGGQISDGQGTINQRGAATTITQDSSRLAINWQRFDIGANETVNFVQPNRNAIALNRVLGADGSRILGNLNANGQVFILNPNGVLFGAGAQVNVGGLVASSLDLSDADFMAGRHAFSKRPGSTGSVVNMGSLRSDDGGYIALVGPHVRNEGTISAPLGTALLAAGAKVTLNLNDGSLLGYAIDMGALDALAENKQLIMADGGQVVLSAEARDSLAKAVVNNTGIIEARTLENKAGRIMLMGDMAVGQVNVGGKLDASAPNGGNGGFIETSAAHVQIADGARITTAAPQGATGTWLIDPQDFVIAATGGDMTGAQLSSGLASSNVLIQSISGSGGVDGDINVNDAVSWSANRLTLNAQNNINVNADLNASGTASLALEYGQGHVVAGNVSEVIIKNAKINLPAGTSNFTTKHGSDGAVKNYTVITALGAQGSGTASDLQGIDGDATTNYALGADIDASATTAWNGGAGFDPISNMTGSLDGLGHSITDLYINRPGQNNVGLFGSSSGATVQNLSLVNAQVTGANQVGALIGSSTVGSVNRVHISGQVNGNEDVGGFIGYNNTTAVYNSASTTDVTGVNNVGGLFGRTNGGVPTTFNYASGTITGSFYVGGLVGYNGFSFLITDSYSTASVSGTRYVGGLAGSHWNGTINNSYSTGSVTGSLDVGGLVGIDVGGGFINNSFWNTQTSGQSASAGGIGLTTAQTLVQANYTGLNFTKDWVMYEGHTAPLLRTFLTPLVVTAADVTKVQDGSPYSGGNGVSYSTTPNSNLLGTVSYGGTSQGATNVGTYVITPGGLYSNQQGYLITYVGGALTVTEVPSPVTQTGPSLRTALNGAQQAVTQKATTQQEAAEQSFEADRDDQDATSAKPLMTIVECDVNRPESHVDDRCR